MKRKILAFILAVATLATCVFTVSISAADQATENNETEPVVKFVGHQRTVVADTTYGIRLIGVVNDLSPEAVGFDLAIVQADGTISVTYSDEVTTVYKSIIAPVDGENKTITAEELGGKYIFASTIKNIPASEGFKGFLCSAYSKDAEGNKTSCETNKIVYNNAERYGFSKLERVYPSYQETKDYSGYNDSDGNNLNAMWDGIAKNGNGYTAFYTNDGSGKKPYSVAKFDSPTVIGRITLFSAAYAQGMNKGITVQASVTGEDGTWETLLTENGELSSTEGWNIINTLTLDVDDSTAYNYIRVVGGEKNGVYLHEVEVYAKTFVTGEFDELTTTHHSDIMDGTWTTDDVQQNGKDPSAIWDGVTGQWDHSTVWRRDYSNEATVPFSRATLGGATKIHKLVVTSGYYKADNDGCEIQASPDNGTTWVTLHKISSNVDATGTKVSWRPEDTNLMSANNTTVTYYITNETEFTDIRVYGNKFSFIEIDVFGSKVSYTDAFAASLNTQLS